MKQYILDNLPMILGFLFGAGGLYDSYLQRKRRKTDALSGMQELYDKFVEDTNQKITEFQAEISSLKSEIERVENSWQKKYNALKKAFDNYKKQHP
ncbi:hypothetical protein V2647_03615 [Tenacibaculum maritimum]|uniref:hypothetical protein n=1 Tax=Tenacibaculum maritimum TaxID=107401 RepID=UPI00260F9144|nr:hypothetical protein [uncultured Polaribacter sp.]